MRRLLSLIVLVALTSSIALAGRNSKELQLQHLTTNHRWYLDNTHYISGDDDTGTGINVYGFITPAAQTEVVVTASSDTTITPAAGLIVIDAIERFEVSIKTQIIYALAHSTGAFGYAKAENFPQLSPTDHTRLLKTITEEADHSKEKFVDHFRAKYGDTHEYLPLWITGEIISFGCALTIYRGIPDQIKRNIAAHYGIPDAVLTSWLQTINVIRNICAHHSRLWNKELGVRPFIPRKNKYPQWHAPVAISQHRIFGILTILYYLLKITAPQSQWKTRLNDLLDKYPEISRWSMGFPDNWKESPLWNDGT